MKDCRTCEKLMPNFLSASTTTMICPDQICHYEHQKAAMQNNKKEQEVK